MWVCPGCLPVRSRTIFFCGVSLFDFKHVLKNQPILFKISIIPLSECRHSTVATRLPDLTKYQ